MTRGEHVEVRQVLTAIRRVTAPGGRTPRRGSVPDQDELSGGLAPAQRHQLRWC